MGVPALTAFLQRGYAVAATDYQGRGGPGVHEYVVGATEVRNVLGSVRAAQHIQSTHAGNNGTFTLQLVLDEGAWEEVVAMTAEDA